MDWRGFGGTSRWSTRSSYWANQDLFTPMGELRDCMVPRLPKQNGQIEEEHRKIPIRSRGKRAWRNLRAQDHSFSGKQVVRAPGMR